MLQVQCQGLESILGISQELQGLQKDPKIFSIQTLQYKHCTQKSFQLRITSVNLTKSVGNRLRKFLMGNFFVQ